MPLATKFSRPVFPPKKFAEDIFKVLSHRRIDGLVMVPSFIYHSEDAPKKPGKFT
jgi:hypothetical protein